MDAQALIQHAIEQNVVAAAQQVEDQIDQQLAALDKLDSEDIETLRQKRVLQLKLLAKKKQEWLSKGHGELTEVLFEKEFFKEMKGEERMICHFYRENWPCKVMDKHLKLLAASHLETKFVKLNAEKAPYLTEKLRIFMLPTLALVKKEKVVDYVVGFDELGGKDDFTTEVLADRLCQAGVLNPDDTRKAPSRPAQPAAVRRGIQKTTDPSDEDSDFD